LVAFAKLISLECVPKWLKQITTSQCFWCFKMSAVFCAASLLCFWCRGVKGLMPFFFPLGVYVVRWFVSILLFSCYCKGLA
jgi:hypothetical protein